MGVHFEGSEFWVKRVVAVVVSWVQAAVTFEGFMIQAEGLRGALKPRAQAIREACTCIWSLGLGFKVDGLRGDHMNLHLLRFGVGD